MRLNPPRASPPFRICPKTLSCSCWAAAIVDRFAVSDGLAALRKNGSRYPRVQAICDYVHKHIAFDYQNARATRTAAEAYNERTGVCRDYAHLASRSAAA